MIKLILKKSALAYLLVSPLYWPSAKAQTQIITSARQSPSASVCQTIGVTKICIDYSRPAVAGRKIWGELVPYGLTAPGWGTSENAPWRAGANENTVITFSTDVKVGGSNLKAGKYGLFVEVLEGNESRVIFTNNTSSWGAYFYDPKETALVITAKVIDHEHTEWLEYQFTDLSAGAVNIVLNWEKMSFSFPVQVDLIATGLEQVRNDMRNTARFSYIGPLEAADWCLKNDCNHEEALKWVEESISMNKTFGNLSVKSELLIKLGRSAEAEVVMKEALPLGSVFEIHGYGRQLIAEKKPQLALEFFQANAKKHPNTWPVDYGLARGYSALGEYKKALTYLEKAEKNCPDQINLNLIKANEDKLRKNLDIN